MIMEAVCIEEYVVALLFPVNLPFSLSQANIVIFSNKNIPRYPFATAQRPLQQPHPSVSTSRAPSRWRERESATASPLSKQFDYELKGANLFDGVEINVSICIQAPAINQLVVAYSITVWMRQMPFVRQTKRAQVGQLMSYYIAALNATCLLSLHHQLSNPNADVTRRLHLQKLTNFSAKG